MNEGVDGTGKVGKGRVWTVEGTYYGRWMGEAKGWDCCWEGRPWGEGHGGR